MKYIVHGKIGGTLLVLLGFAAWLVASNLITDTSEWHPVVTYSIAGLAFFLVGCFLPEYRGHRFILGRRSVLQLMAFFFWLAGSTSVRLSIIGNIRDSPTWIGPIISFGSVVIAFGSFFIATYLIRGFRAPIEYAEDTIKTHKPEFKSEVHG